MKRLLLAWFLAGSLVLWMASSAWVFWQDHTRMAKAQDEQLALALALITEAVSDAQPMALPLSKAGAQQRLTFRISSLGGDWLAGQAEVPVCPWVQRLPQDGSALYYVSRIGGQLTWTAAAMRSPGRPELPARVVVQTVAPLAERWPSASELASGTLGLLWLEAALLSLWTWLGIELASAWLRRAGVDSHCADHLPADGVVPQEIEPLVQRTRALLAAQSVWVDEQRRFLANASHQLRTPMTVLRTQLQSAMSDPAIALDVLPQMLHTVDRVTGLANQLLSLTKLEMLKRRGELGPIDVRAVARDAVMELSPLIAGKRIDFSLDEAQLSAPADPTMLGELMRNLLSNAIHHAPVGGKVGVVLRSSPRPVAVIWDEGPGIDDSIRPRLFHPFAASNGGVGLGLSICLQIAESMGASVRLLNRVESGTIVGVDAIVAWGQAP